MSKQLKQKIKTMSGKENPTVNKTLAEKVGSNMVDSTDPVIAAQGAIVAGSAIDLNKAIVVEGKANDAAKAANIAKGKQNGDTAVIFNAQAVIVQQNNPDNTELYTALGYELTAATAQDATPPAQVAHGTMTSGDYIGTSDIQFDSMPGCEFTMEITKGDPSVAENYIQVTAPESVYTKSSFTIYLPIDYRNVTIWSKVTAHNSAGAGPASLPFGGRKFE